MPTAGIWTATAPPQRTFRVHSSICRVQDCSRVWERRKVTLFGGRDVGAASAPTEAGVQTSIKSYGAELKFSTHFRKPEVLAPAGGHEQLRAAVESGADAVYLGLTSFNARARAANFTPEELPGVVQFCHDRDVKVFVTLNVLVYDTELSEIERVIWSVAEAGADALIVQDVGVVRLARRVAPNLRIHGSTQMSITSGEGAEFARELGCDRVVLGRELTVHEIARTAEATSAEIEVFVHGALCVSYSGQCFSSEAWGGRSANRGQCAQACRLPYGLLVDGFLKELGDVKYLLSPQDLMAVELVPNLMEAGVSCFKIEGRLKGPEYVALTTKAYRRAVDIVWDAYLQQQMQEKELQLKQSQQQQWGHSYSIAALTGTIPESGSLGDHTLQSGASHETDKAGTKASKQNGSEKDLGGETLLPKELDLQLRQVFARGQDVEHAGLSTGFLQGKKHQQLVRGRNPRHRGVCLGRVIRVQKDSVIIACLEDIKVGDGVVFETGAMEHEEPGGSVTKVAEPGKQLVKGERQRLLDLQKEWKVKYKLRQVVVRGVDTRKLRIDHLVWRTKQEGLMASIRQEYEGHSAVEKRRVTVDAVLSGMVGEPLMLTLSDENGRCGIATGTEKMVKADSKPVTAEQIRKALGQTLGADTAFLLRDVNTQWLPLAHGVFVPMKEIKQIRRKAVEALVQSRRSNNASTGIAAGPVRMKLHEELMSRSQRNLAPIKNASSETQISVLCRNPEQAAAAATLDWVEEITLDFLGTQGLKNTIQALRKAGKRVCIALPRITKPEEQGVWKFFVSLQPDALLLRSAGLLFALRKHAHEHEQRNLLSVGTGSRAGKGCKATLHATSVPPSVVANTEKEVLRAQTKENLDSDLKPAEAQQSSGSVTHESVWSTDSEAEVESHSSVEEQKAVDAAGTSSNSTATKSAAQKSPRKFPELRGDFSLNAANSLSAATLLGSGLSRLTLTHDLNAEQMADLALNLPDRLAERLEVVLHQHLPIFHTEHCVFCRFLSDGNSKDDCGHPCEQHTVHLRDASGHDHLVLADMGCRNTVFNAEAQSGLPHAVKLQRAGFRHFRIELVGETADVVPELLQKYKEVLDGDEQWHVAQNWLHGVPDSNGNEQGCGQGSFVVRREMSRDTMKPTASMSTA